MKVVEYAGARVGANMAARWQAIEAEYQEPIRDVIQGLREQGLIWRDVAATLNCSEKALIRWRRRLGIPTGKTLYYPNPNHPRHADALARRCGYESMAEAIRDLRMRQGLTQKAAARVLGVHYKTLDKHTPPELRGLIQQDPDRRWRNGSAKPTRDHPWHSWNTAEHV